MDWLIPLAAKSFLVAGGALLLLRLLRNRSAADRSWIAHLALAGLVLLPVASVALPTLDVAGPEFLVGRAEVESPSSAVPIETAPAPAVTSALVADLPSAGGAAIDWPFWGYAAPAALLLLLTLIALARLFVLKARASVLVDAPWLTALARAQKRMGFKHGTALLTSNELPSPISWGVVRPVILLNAEAAQSPDQAEAIITHELAHVAHFDWAKLLLARVAIAIFWFNPFVWFLAREAHQLREEAADDAVLATDIEDTDYARLLVGVARHECRGLLIGAHGVAPARNSLARRVKRVLDGAVKRAPGGWQWGSAAAFFAAGMAVPVAALNLVPALALLCRAFACSGGQLAEDSG
jgi:bla regulator protein blaR1